MVDQKQEDLHDCRSTSGESSSLIIEEDDTSSSDDSECTPGGAFVFLETPKRPQYSTERNWRNSDASISSMSLSLSSYDSLTDDDDFDDAECSTGSEASDWRLRFRRNRNVNGEISVQQSLDNASSDDYTFTSVSSSWDSDGDETYSSCEEETIGDEEATSELEFIVGEGGVAQSNRPDFASKEVGHGKRLPVEETYKEVSRGNIQQGRNPRRRKKDNMPIQENRGRRPIRRTQSNRISRVRRKWEQERPSSANSLDGARSLPNIVMMAGAKVHAVHRDEVQHAYHMLRKQVNLGMVGLGTSNSRMQQLVSSSSMTSESALEEQEASEISSCIACNAYSGNDILTAESPPQRRKNEESTSSVASWDHAIDDGLSSVESCKTVEESEPEQAEGSNLLLAPQEGEVSCELAMLVAKTTLEVDNSGGFVEKSNGTASTIDTQCSEERCSAAFYSTSPERVATISSLETMRGKAKCRIQEAANMIASSRLTKELNVASLNAAKLMRGVSERTGGIAIPFHPQEVNDRHHRFRNSWNASLVSTNTFLKKLASTHGTEQNIPSK